MELYVQKELKDRFEPLAEELKGHKEEFKLLSTKVEAIAKELNYVDNHYNGVSKAILSRHGIILKQVNEQNILQAFKLISWKEQ